MRRLLRSTSVSLIMRPIPRFLTFQSGSEMASVPDFEDMLSLLLPKLSLGWSLSGLSIETEPRNSTNLTRFWSP
jgi:hypothetical protein